MGALAVLTIVACFGPRSSEVSAGAPRQPGTFTMTPEEARTVGIFRDVSPSVAFISTSVLYRRSYFSRNLEEIPYGTGSGFVWDKRGHVVTNYHVIRDFVERKGQGITISVTLSDESSYKVQEVVGYVIDKELAVLKIDAPPEKLQPIPLGNSSDLQVGQKAIAIGNPFGLDYTLTVGVISALGREIQALSGRRIRGVIQTDAAINRGNSGGPLLNSSGQLIGINTAILSPSGTNAGIGFAIPGDTVRRYVDMLILNDGKISGAGLGIRYFPDLTIKRLGIQGILIDDVIAGGAAAKAGMRGTRFYRNGELQELGDILVKLGNDRIADSNSLRDALEKRKVGETVDATVLRDGEEKVLTVTLQEVEY
jgi:S1-C subfamily serine protease